MDFVRLIVSCAATFALGAYMAGCTDKQKVDARTALDISMCVQSVILEHVDEDLKDPVVASQLGLEIVNRCHPRPPVADAGA